MSSIVKKKQELLSKIYLNIEEFYGMIDIEESKEKEYGKYLSYIKKIPKMVRKNGLILTMCYLNKKSNSENKNDIENKIYNSIVKTYLECNKENFHDINLFDKIKYYLDGEKDIESEIREFSIKTIKFFEIYSILADGFGSDFYESK